jgi:hypothetical protein
LGVSPLLAACCTAICNKLQASKKPGSPLCLRQCQCPDCKPQAAGLVAGGWWRGLGSHGVGVGSLCNYITQLYNMPHATCMPATCHMPQAILLCHVLSAIRYPLSAKSSPPTAHSPQRKHTSESMHMPSALMFRTPNRRQRNQLHTLCPSAIYTYVGALPIIPTSPCLASCLALLLLELQFRRSFHKHLLPSNQHHHKSLPFDSRFRSHQNNLKLRSSECRPQPASPLRL